MAMLPSFLFGVMLAAFVVNTLGAMDVGRGNSSEHLQGRKKRGLIFENGGVVKLVIGPIIGIPFEDPTPWRSMICGYNLHGGEYAVPTVPLYPWDKWETIYARSQSTTSIEPDGSREFIYLAIENYLERTQGSGRDCLLRSICENAQVDHHMDMFGEILNVILTPGKENLDTVYREAVGMGKSGVNCIHYYWRCPKGKHVFDQFIEEEV